MMSDWPALIEPYYGKEIRLWIEDVSGEKKTAPSVHRLHKVEFVDGKEIKFFIGAAQFLSVPLLEGEATKLVAEGESRHFVTVDESAQLIYWVYFV
jgi:hypothetical protein